MRLTTESLHIFQGGFLCSFPCWPKRNSRVPRLKQRGKKTSKSLEATGEHSTTLCPRAFRKIKEKRHQVKLEHETRLTSNELWSIMLMHVKRKAKRPAKEWRLSCTKCGHEWTVEVKALTWSDYPEPQLCPICQGKSIRNRQQLG